MPEQSITGDSPLIKGQPYTYYFFLPKKDTSSGSGSNPDGGQVDIAGTNYLASLFSQFMSLSLGSVSAPLLNLPDSMQEPYNVSNSTFLKAAYTGQDLINRYATLRTIFAPHLAGYCNPIHLVGSFHFNGSGTTISVLPIDQPVYQPFINNNFYSVQNPTNQQSMFLNGSDGVITSSQPASTIAQAFLSNIGSGGSATFGNVTGSQFVKYDLGAGRSQTLKSAIINIGGGSVSGITIEGSNDDISYTPLTWTYVNSAQNNLTNSTAYRYYRFTFAITSQISNVRIYGFATSVGTEVKEYNTSVFKFGTASLHTNGYVIVGSSNQTSHNQFSNLDFNYNAWIRFDEIHESQSLLSSGGTRAFEFGTTANKLYFRYSTNGTTWTQVESSVVSLTTGVFYHISIGRTGNTLYFFLDGVAVGTADLTGVTINNASTSTSYNCDTFGLNQFFGYMDEVEIWSRFNPYSAPFVPPTSERTTAVVHAFNVQSAACYIPSGVADLNVSILIDETQFASLGVPVLGTDYTVQVSLDNGLTWSTGIIFAKSFQMSTSTTVYQALVDATAMTNTNQLVYKINAPETGKPLKFDGIIMYWTF